jgi:hypothetical protein
MSYLQTAFQTSLKRSFRTRNNALQQTATKACLKYGRHVVHSRMDYAGTEGESCLPRSQSGGLSLISIGQSYGGSHNEKVTRTLQVLHAATQSVDLNKAFCTFSYRKVPRCARNKSSDCHGSHKWPTQFCADLLIKPNFSQIGR